jgi:hypothetical protein
MFLMSPSSTRHSLSLVPLIAVTVRSGDKKVPVNIDTVKTVLEFKVSTEIREPI